MPRLHLRLLSAVLFLASAPVLQAQEPAFDASSTEDDEPTVRDGGVGYIDSAFPLSQFRFRFDAAWGNNRPTRGEFFYPRGGAAGPGLPRPEPNVDFQELSTYLEYAPGPCFSVFLETPYRLLNPTVNNNNSGFSDLVTGFKWVLCRSNDSICTFQLKNYCPTGEAERGLGTHHYSIEPGLLYSHLLSERLQLDAELRYWVPIGGTNFAGDVIRYGLGLTFGQRNPCGFWLTPVTEFVGWTFLDGRVLTAFEDGSTLIEDAAGDTIVNGKFGVRFGCGECWDIYAGYGRAFTGDVLYRDILRVEWRWKF